MLIPTENEKAVFRLKAIVNTKIILEDGILWDGTVLLEGDRILAAGHAREIGIPEGAERIDAGGLYTAPGLVDIHCHGVGPYSFARDAAICAAHFLAHGETTVLPTFYQTLTYDEMLEGASRVRETAKSGCGRVIGGLYMEGPFMDEGIGSNRSTTVHTGRIEEVKFRPLVDGLGDFVRVWAIDPARENIGAFLRYVRSGYPRAVFALGHSAATAEQCDDVARYGITLQTHHTDSGRAPARCQANNGSGCDDWALYHPEVYTELICDRNGIHVPPGRIRLLMRTKGVERVILITDSNHSPDPGRNAIERGVWYGPDLSYDDEGLLSGSRMTLENACRNLMTHTGYGLCHAIRCATLNPARALGLDGEIGSVTAGKRANLILIDDAVNVKKVFLEGEEMPTEDPVVIETAKEAKA